MKFESYIFNALDAWTQNKKDLALLLASIATEKCAAKHFNQSQVNGHEYKKFLRLYFWLIEKFARLPSSAQIEYPVINGTKGHPIKDEKGNIVDKLDLADLIYNIYRCSLAHGNEIPIKYSLIQPQREFAVTAINYKNGDINLPDQIIIGLLAVCVFAKASRNTVTNMGDRYWLSWRDELTESRFFIDKAWGEEDFLKDFLERQKLPEVRIVQVAE